MEIEQFIAQSEGIWSSMRSGHSLAFKQFEQVISKITIDLLPNNDTEVVNLLRSIDGINQSPISPFCVKWEAESNWVKENSPEVSCGSSILIPIPQTKHNGLFVRSLGYTEPIPSLSTYSFLNDGTLIIKTEYDQTFAEERIWFISKHVRCRSSAIYTSKSRGVLQTSFSSEVKILNNQKF